MLIELAELSPRAAESSLSRKAALTMRWQSSNEPATSTAVTLPPKCGQLFFLQRADPARRVEDDDAGSGDIVEGAGHRSAGVARGGRQDGQAFALLAREPGHQPRHQAGPEILEGQGRAVEQLQHPDVGRDLDHRHRKIQGLGAHALQFRARHRALEQGVADFRSHRREGQGFPALPEIRGQRRDGVRHVKPAVRSQGVQYRLAKRDVVGRISGAVKMDAAGFHGCRYQVGGGGGVVKPKSCPETTNRRNRSNRARRSARLVGSILRASRLHATQTPNPALALQAVLALRAMLRPTMRNALCSFDEWAHRDGLWRHIMRLEEQQLLTTDSDAPRMDVSSS